MAGQCSEILSSLPSQTNTRRSLQAIAAMYLPFGENLILVNQQPSVAFGGQADKAPFVESQTRVVPSSRDIDTRRSLGENRSESISGV